MDWRGMAAGTAGWPASEIGSCDGWRAGRAGGAAGRAGAGVAAGGGADAAGAGCPVGAERGGGAGSGAGPQSAAAAGSLARWPRAGPGCRAVGRAGQRPRARTRGGRRRVGAWRPGRARGCGWRCWGRWRRGGTGWRCGWGRRGGGGAGLLGCAPGELVRRETVIDVLWGQRPPATAAELVRRMSASCAGCWIRRAEMAACWTGPGRRVAGCGWGPVSWMWCCSRSWRGRPRRRRRRATRRRRAGCMCRRSGLWRGEPGRGRGGAAGHPAVAGLARRRAEVVAGLCAGGVPAGLA